MCCGSSRPSRTCQYFYDVGTDRYKGVCHIALPEEGHTRPGEVLLGTDSHTCTAGAFGEFATGIGNTDAGFVMGTGKLWLKVPPTMRFVFHGQLPPYLMAKDLILAVIGDIGCDGATYRAMEFDGDGVYRPEHRRAHDPVQHGHRGRRQERRHRPGPGHARLRQQPRQRSGKPYHVVKSDAGAKFCFEKVYDVTQAGAGGRQAAQPGQPGLRVARCKGTKLDRAYIGSCTGGKMTDFRAAAEHPQGQDGQDRHLRGAGDQRDRRRARRRRSSNGQTLEEIFLAAGAKIGEPSCAACLGGPSDTFGRLNQPISCISTTNRNFPGRMGHKEAKVFLASPLTVAASAIAGTIADPREHIR